MPYIAQTWSHFLGDPRNKFGMLASPCRKVARVWSHRASLCFPYLWGWPAHRPASAPCLTQMCPLRNLKFQSKSFAYLFPSHSSRSFGEKAINKDFERKQSENAFPLLTFIFSDFATIVSPGCLVVVDSIFQPLLWATRLGLVSASWPFVMPGLFEL